MTAYQLAIASLLHQRGRTAISVLGTTFAVVLIFMQLGFLGSVENTASLLYDKLEFDVLIVSSEYIDMSRPGTVDRNRLVQASGIDGVAEVVPLQMSTGLWRNPTDDPILGRRKWQLNVLGIEPGALPRTFRADSGIFTSKQDLKEKQAILARFQTGLLDVLSRPDFGRREQMPIGTTTEFNGQSIELAGYFKAGTGFSYTGLLMLSEESFAHYTGSNTRAVTFGLVQLEAGQDVNAMAEKLRTTLPPDTRIFTRQEVIDFERNYWIDRTAVGQFFYFGVMLALVVGAIFIYQMMVADIKKHMPEYATLKAMGYKFPFLFAIVIWQSLFMAAMGFSFGLLASMGCYEAAKSAAGIPIGMTPERIVIVLILTTAMCTGSGFLAVRKVRSADPANLF